MSGPIFMVIKYILLRFQIDDPLDAISVHGAGGVWGTITVHILRRDGPSGEGLAWNLIGLVAIISWTGITCFVIFYSLSRVKLLRVDTEKEFRGIFLQMTMMSLS
jgi:Amt family ammonium transporter